MILKFKKQISLIFAGSFSLVFAACYGMPTEMELATKKLQTVNENNEAIPGLQVQLLNNGQSILKDTCNNKGTVYFYDLDMKNKQNNYKIIIKDIDDTLNGGLYAEKTINIVDSIGTYTVKMEE